MAEKKFWFISAAILAALLLTTGARAESRLEFPGPAPGDAQGRVYKEGLILQNRLLSCAWSVSEERFKPRYVKNKLTSNTIKMQEAQCFQIILEGGQVIKASELKIVGGPKFRELGTKQRVLPIGGTVWR